MTPAPTQTLVIMVKEPCVGQVKSRLAKDIGLARAASIYRHISALIIRRLARDPRWRTVLAVSPDSALNSRFWPPHIARVYQGKGDLGARMHRAINTTNPGPVVVIGSDIPDIGAHHIAAAFARLGHQEIVIGPGQDGGYWLIGCAQTQKKQELFNTIRWSTEHTLKDTLACLQGRRIAFLETLNDIDTAQDYYAWEPRYI